MPIYFIHIRSGSDVLFLLCLSVSCQVSILLFHCWFYCSYSLAGETINGNNDNDPHDEQVASYVSIALKNPWYHAGPSEEFNHKIQCINDWSMIVMCITAIIHLFVLYQCPITPSWPKECLCEFTLAQGRSAKVPRGYGTTKAPCNFTWRWREESTLIVTTLVQDSLSLAIRHCVAMGAGLKRSESGWQFSTGLWYALYFSCKCELREWHIKVRLRDGFVTGGVWVFTLEWLCIRYLC